MSLSRPNLSRLTCRALLAAAMIASAASACAAPAGEFTVLRTLPHDTAHSTQGLELWGGVLIESTGLRGQSRALLKARETGHVRRHHTLPRAWFGEGITRVGDTLVMLTWQAGRAVVMNPQLQPIAEHRYSGEGWGLCHDGQWLWMSDGSNTLQQRRPDDFKGVASVAVTDDGNPVSRLNELECVDGAIYANIWQTDDIVRIDPATGHVTARWDLSTLHLRLRKPDWWSDREHVLNGIAHDPVTGHFLLTGKRWPAMFEVDLHPTAPQATR